MLDPDLDEYLTEYRLQSPTEPISHYEGKSATTTITANIVQIEIQFFVAF